jgi:segregation and condensation protein B
MNENSKKILAYLFTEAGAVGFIDLAKYFNISNDEVVACLDEISAWQNETPFVLVRTENDVALTLSPEMTASLSELDEKEGQRELTKSALETLAVILYKNGANRAEIDYIRGVNSSFSIRSLVSRGYVARGVKNIYLPTADLLVFLGISTLDELPDKESIINKLNEITNQDVSVN